MSVPDWWIYHGTGEDHPWQLPPAPPWRQFTGTSPAPPDDQEGFLHWPSSEASLATERRSRMASAYRADPEEVRIVNAAIYLRRPLLVTGPPGSGKSTLAYSVAHELGLGRVLHWPVSSRTVLKDGLYRYDAIGRLQEVTLREKEGTPDRSTRIGKYLSLGPLGTALLPTDRPRMLLVDELDKGDVDLPNDMLGVFEDGEFTIPELQRDANPVVTVLTEDGEPTHIDRGRVVCKEFPVVIVTSNGEREFPAAFTRRCIRLDIDPPSEDKLRRIVYAHLGPEALKTRASQELFDSFATRLKRPEMILATDQLLNALRMESSVDAVGDVGWPRVIEHLLRPLNQKP